MKQRVVRVAKLGGSLLDCRSLPEILRRWLSQQAGTTVLIIGGGPFADLIRSADEQFELGDEAAHALALHTMRLATELCSHLLPGCELVRDLELLRRHEMAAPHSAWLFDPYDFATSELGRSLLPASWAVTSDSIAAAVAARLEADELVLLKSVDLPTAWDWRRAGEQGYVDRHFHIAARELSQVRWVNLRRLSET